MDRETEIARLRELTNSLQQQHTFHLDTIALLKEGVAAWRERAEAAEDEVVQALSELRRVHAEIVEVQAQAKVELNRAHRKIGAYEQSQSWRITLPFRAFITFARRLRLLLSR